MASSIMNLLDRYVLRKFLEPFFLCFSGILGIWLINDFINTGNDFLRSGGTFSQLAAFYLFQVPVVFLLSAPWATLLALLRCCYQMSRSNELISMLCAGRSLPRVLAPIVGFGVLLSLFSLVLHYEIAPKFNARAKILREEVKDKTTGARDLREGIIRAHLYRDRKTDRTWWVGQMSAENPVLEQVLVIQHAPDGSITRKWYAEKAIHDPLSGRWTLQKGMIVDLNPQGEILEPIDRFEALEQRTLDHWPETPRRIAAPSLDPQFLTVPQLREVLSVNSDLTTAQLAPYLTALHDRYALPWNCLVVVAFGAPLGIVYSRRGAVQGIGWALVCLALNMISHNLALAFGKGCRIHPALAPWIPGSFFFLLGLGLLWMRSKNRDFSSLFPRKP
ncbi:MAG: Lipopolysaccharide export system permease protein LptG [Verrucomicrobiota bacterium]